MFGLGIAEIVIILIIVVPGLTLFALVTMALIKYIRGDKFTEER